MAMSPQERTALLITKAQTGGSATYSIWICQGCLKTYVVPNLARDCEDRHERDGWPTPAIYATD